MLMALIAALFLQQAVVWETPAPPPEPPSPAVATIDLPDWAVRDPFAWERAQCSPLVMKDASVEACQRRVRTDLQLALGNDLPAGLVPPAEPAPCTPRAAAGGGYAVQCGAPERQVAARTATPQEEICETRPTRQGGGVAFTQQCGPSNARDERGGLTFHLGGKD